MRSPAFVLASTVLVSLLTVSQSGIINEPADQVLPYSVIDPIIKAILEQLRKQLADLKLDDIDQSITNPSLNATFTAKNILIQNADKFVIRNLNSNIIPLRLTNLTLFWDEINASAAYDAKATLAVPGNRGSLELYGSGDARAVLNGLFFTIGANVELKDKAIQIKPRGLFGFDVRIEKANVALSSLLGREELGEYTGTFLSKIIPVLVETFKKPFFDIFQDDIIREVNKILKKNPSFFMDEEPLLPESSLDSLDSSEEIGSFLEKSLVSEIEEPKFGTQF